MASTEALMLFSGTLIRQAKSLSLRFVLALLLKIETGQQDQNIVAA